MKATCFSTLMLCIFSDIELSDKNCSGTKLRWVLSPISNLIERCSSSTSSSGNWLYHMVKIIVKLTSAVPSFALVWTRFSNFKRMKTGNINKKSYRYS